MKLYTEEMVKRAISLTLDSPTHSNLVLDHLTPIELPSNEEIKTIAIKSGLERTSVVFGADWVIEQLKLK